MTDAGPGDDPFNRLPGGRARAVLEYLARQIVDDPNVVEVDSLGGGRGDPVRLRPSGP